MPAVPPSSPSRRHFIGIAAAAARKLSMLSVSVSALSLFGARGAASHGYEHERHHLWHLYGHRQGVSHGHGPGFGTSGTSMSGTGGRYGHSNGSKSGNNGSGASNGSGSAGSGSGSAGGSGSANGSGSAGKGATSANGSGASGSGSGSANGSGSAANGSGPTNGSGASGSGSAGSGTTIGSGSDGYGTGASGSGSSGSGSTSAGLRCFAPGTLILTDAGEVPVENLLIGMHVMTSNGPKPVKWIGRQTLQRNQAVAWHPRVLPVRISKFAIDEQTPRRDVCVSQWHSLFVDGVLIPARHLVNGKSIRFDEASLAAEVLEYFHVVLDTHEIIFADGLPVESFMYAGGVVAWDNHGDYLQRYGVQQVMAPFAPIHSYDGGFDELGGLIRLVASRIVDVRDPIQIAHDRLKERAVVQAA